MAAPGCVFHRVLTRSKSGSSQASPSSPAVCRESLRVLDLQRYSRDQGSAVYFPQAVLHGDDLYDVMVTDGDCKLRVTLDPGLNRLVERHVLRPGATLRNAAFSPAMAAQLPQSTGAGGNTNSYRLVSVEVKGQAADEEDEELRMDLDSLTWFGSSEPADPLVPLRANRITFLPLWNNVDYSGAVWREAPPTEAEEEDEEEEAQRPAVSVQELRDSFLSGRRGSRGAVLHQLIVRIVNKSHLMYYGRPDQNCECPYKALLEVCDRTGSVCVVLWNTVCVTWYRSMKPGDIISLRRYRVKQHYQATNDDIEISVNSRNPAARISILPESSVSPQHLPPLPTYDFNSSQELSARPHSTVCDVIGLVTFSGRPERIRSKDGKGAELLEYRWLQLEDGTSNQPIMVKLFCTSQPESHHKLHPLSVVVCTRVRLIRSAGQTSCFYLTNTTHTQVYCTGLGHHSEMPYRKLRPVQHFLQWLRSQDDGEVMSKAVIGGFFIYPPPPVSLETYMKDRKGVPGFLRGAELQREVKRLCYRERQTFCIQATITMVMHCYNGEEDSHLVWTDRASSLSSHLSRPSPSSSSSSHSSRLPLSSLSPSSSVSLVCPLTPHRPDRKGLWKRKQIPQVETPRKRRPSAALKQEEDNNTETLPMHYSHSHREEQAVAVAMGGRVTAEKFDCDQQSCYKVRLRALSDSVTVDVLFLPHSSSSSLYPPLLRHSNRWLSVLSHGAFSSHTPPPSPGDLVAMASQLAKQRLVCIVEACHLGGATTELVLSRAFLLTN